jgi:hypothetical protein
MRCFLVLAAFVSSAAYGQTQLIQTQGGVSPVLQVQQLAPQLVQFAGGEVNFQNLVNGLAFGVPVTLTSAIAPGVNQIVTFTPVGTMSPAQIAQTLVSAQQVAIGNGIAVPTAQQLGVILNGGALPTAVGSTAVNGLVGGNALTTTTAGAQVTAPALAVGRSFNTSDSPFPRGVSDSPSAAAAPFGVSANGGATTNAPALRVMPGTAAGGATAPAATTPRWGLAR